MIGLSRSGFGGRSGARPSITAGSYDAGVQAGSPITLGAGTTRKALIRVLRDQWDQPGLTLTLRVYRRVGGVRVLVTQGSVSSGPSTSKGVAKPSPAFPILDGPFLADGDFEIDVETSVPARYSAEVAE